MVVAHALNILVQSIVQSIVQSMVQSIVQSMVQSIVQSIVQSRVQSPAFTVTPIVASYGMLMEFRTAMNSILAI